MFGTAIVEPAVKVPLEQLIPLSVLALDLDTPAQGWAAHLATRDIEIVLDDLGRAAVTRTDARRLFVGRAEHEAKRAEFLAAADRQAEEFDRQWRAQLGVGIPASAIPAGMSYAEAMFANELNSHAYQPRRRSMAEDLFDNSGELVFHPTISTPDEE
jgi:hypothetical protein